MMARSKASTVEKYLAELPVGKREAVEGVRATILENLPSGYSETMSHGMISYEIPLETYPDTYNGRPLGYLALAAQKNHCALYMMAVYADPEQKARLSERFERAGKKLDMGKSCVRFRQLDDLPLDVIGELVASTPPEGMIALYEKSRTR